MSFSPLLTHLAAAEEHTRELPIPTWAYGALAAFGFAVLLGVLWTFRNTAAKTGQHTHGDHH